MKNKLFVLLPTLILVMACSLLSPTADTSTVSATPTVERSAETRAVAESVPTLQAYTTYRTYYVRSGPGTEYEVLAVLTEHRVEIVESVGNWHLIRYVDGGNVYHGFIHANSNREEK